TVPESIKLATAVFGSRPHGEPNLASGAIHQARPNRSGGSWFLKIQFPTLSASGRAEVQPVLLSFTLKTHFTMRSIPCTSINLPKSLTAVTRSVVAGSGK